MSPSVISDYESGQGKCLAQPYKELVGALISAD